MGIETTDRLVVYDRLNIFSACRVYWTFKYFGHKQISVLDGVH
jgi:thiosulfate/3-mercaptopyruvate sulfurtransferase